MNMEINIHCHLMIANRYQLFFRIMRLQTTEAERKVEMKQLRRTPDWRNWRNMFPDSHYAALRTAAAECSAASVSAVPTSA